MKKILQEKIDKYINEFSNSYNGLIYYSDAVPDARYSKYKYFLKYHNTHKVKESFKTQKELENYIDNAFYKKNLYNDFKKSYLASTETLDIFDYYFDENNILIVDIIDKNTCEFRFKLQVKYNENGEVIWY